VCTYWDKSYDWTTTGFRSSCLRRRNDCRIAYLGVVVLVRDRLFVFRLTRRRRNTTGKKYSKKIPKSPGHDRRADSSTTAATTRDRIENETPKRHYRRRGSGEVRCASVGDDDRRDVRREVSCVVRPLRQARRLPVAAGAGAAVADVNAVRRRRGDLKCF